MSKDSELPCNARIPCHRTHVNIELTWRLVPLSRKIAYVCFCESFVLGKLLSRRGNERGVVATRLGAQVSVSFEAISA